jgi:hypothetical protein
MPASVGSKPLEFVETVASERHCALFYDDAAYARRIEFAFIEKGLQQKERCFYLVHSDEEARSTEELMSERESLKAAIGGGQLRTYMDSRVPESPDDVPALIEERRGRIGLMSPGPCRLVGVSVPEIRTPSQLAAQVAIDVAAQGSMQGSSRTVLCSYQFEKVRQDMRDDWFLKMMANHHSAIFAPRGGEGVAFDMR